jgi:hypothetical protein
MPDYELILWDMNRFDIHSVPFVEQACAARKWAFASDYIRCYALYTEGGIYLDSDVKVFRNFDKFLNHRAFFGSIYYNQPMPGERLGYRNWLSAECFGTEKGHPLMKNILQIYENQPFKTISNVASMGVAPVVLSNACLNFGWEDNKKVDKPLTLQEGIVIYPKTYFAQIGCKLSILNTHSIHIATSGWYSPFVVKKDLLFILRNWHHKMMNLWWFKHLHLKRKQLQKRIVRF